MRLFERTQNSSEEQRIGMLLFNLQNNPFFREIKQGYKISSVGETISNTVDGKKFTVTPFTLKPRLWNLFPRLQITETKTQRQRNGIDNPKYSFCFLTVPDPKININREGRGVVCRNILGYYPGFKEETIHAIIKNLINTNREGRGVVSRNILDYNPGFKKETIHAIIKNFFQENISPNLYIFFPDYTIPEIQIIVPGEVDNQSTQAKELLGKSILACQKLEELFFPKDEDGNVIPPNTEKILALIPDNFSS